MFIQLCTSVEMTPSKGDCIYSESDDKLDAW